MKYTITDYAITLAIICWVLVYGIEVTHHPFERIEKKCKRFLKELEELRK